MPKRLRFFVSTIFFMLLCSTVSAHQQKEAYTTMLFNERTGNLEVSHRFYVHDAEHALAKALKKKADLSLDGDSMLEFADYVRNSFKVKVSDEEELEFETVGQEIDGKYFWVYQEVPIDAEFDTFQLNMTALQEVWPKQINHINLEKDGKVRSVRLNKQEPWQSIELSD